MRFFHFVRSDFLQYTYFYAFYEELKEMESSLFLKGLFKKISVWIRYEKPLKYSQKKLSCLDFMFQSKRSFENEQANAYTYEVFVCMYYIPSLASIYLQ